MKWYLYKMLVRHDHGELWITTAADSAKAAREIVMRAERCPRRSILSTKNIRRIA